MIQLRPRQAQAIEDLRAAYRSGYKAPILVAPTGFGKTATSTAMIRSALAKGLRVWFIAHLREILVATSRALTREGIPHGWIAAGQLGDRRRAVQVVSVQTLARRLDIHEPPDLMIVDEAHLAVAATYQQIFEWAKAGPRWYEKGGCHLLHLTATPQRLDGRGMGEVADVIVPTCSTQDLIDEVLLAPIRYFAPPPPDLAGVHTLGGEFNTSELAAAMDKPKITGDALDHWLRIARGRPTVAFCCSIEHARHVAEQFAAAGVRARAVSGDTDIEERDQALVDVQEGRLDLVTNCALWVAGVDAPALSCCIWLAPTQSLTKFLQGCGRTLRTHEGKADTIILDHAGNAHRHGMPTEAREWSLDGAAKRGAKKGPVEVPIKQCPACYATVAAAATVCVSPTEAGTPCGHVFQVKARQIAQVDGELAEMDAERIAAQARQRRGYEQTLARTKEQLIETLRKRGHKRPELMAMHVLRGRFAKQQREGRGVEKYLHDLFGDQP